MEKMHTPTTLPGFPTAPGKWPVLGHMRTLARDTRDTLVKYAQELGPAYWLSMGFNTWTLVVSGPAARQIMKNKETSSDIIGGRANHITSDTLLVEDGDPHKRMRGAMNAPFTPKGISAANVGSLIGEVMDTHLREWQGEGTLPIHTITSEIALDVIFRILGVPGADLPQWRKIYNEYINAGIIIPIDLPGTPVRKSIQAADWLDKQFEELLERALEQGDEETMLGALAHGKDDKGRTMTRRELLSNLRILGLAGHETTASTMAWMMLHAAAEPEIWEKLCAEANAADNPPLSPKDLKNFPYAEAFFRECLRLYPPVGMLPPRRVLEPISVGDKTIPPNTRVSTLIFEMSMNEEEYPEPEKIKPERWTERSRRPGPAEAVQFGGGPHFCLGYHLAVLEGTQFIVYVARRLTELGLTPTLSEDGIPTPKFIPLTRPPSSSKVVLKSAS